MPGKRLFLPTPSARRATVQHIDQDDRRHVISTHALREEGDGRVTVAAVLPHLFLPTPSARRATEQKEPLRLPQQISTHALREEGDIDAFILGFNHNSSISTHALREEGDALCGTNSSGR